MSKTVYYLVITGDKKEAILTVEERFRDHLAGQQVEVIKTGKVESLLKTYRDIVFEHNQPEAVYIFSHQDAYPALQPGMSENFDISQLPKEHEYLEAAFSDPAHWVDVAEVLLRSKDTGFLGVAGALGITPGSAWWNYPEISGAVLHKDSDGNLGLNPYGIYGQVLVLDGLFLMCKGKTILDLGEFDIDEDRFHFYDMELCIRAHSMGKKNYTIPLMMIHESSGATIKDQKWLSDLDRFSENIQFYLQSGKNQDK